MSWVEKTPRHPYFCGMPPCPLCYVWADDDGRTVDGVKKMGYDLLGKTSITPEEMEQLNAAAEKIHSENLARLEEPEIKATAEQVAYFMLDKRREAARSKPIKKRAKVLDHIDIGAIKAAEDKAALAARVQARREKEWSMQRQAYLEMMRNVPPIPQPRQPLPVPAGGVSEDEPVRAQRRDDDARFRWFRDYANDIIYRR